MGLSKRITVSGVANHKDLEGRTLADAHPQSAISGLEAAITNITSVANSAAGDAASAEDAAAAAASAATQANGKADTAITNIGNLATLPTNEKTSLVGAIAETFTNANDGKNIIAAAVIGKGGTANGGMTYPELGDAIIDIPNVTNSTGDATEADVRLGKGFSNAAGVGKIGGLDLSMLTPENLKKDVVGPDGQIGTYDNSTHFTPGTNVIMQDTGTYSTSSTVYTKLREKTLLLGGTYRISFELRTQGNGMTAYAQIYRNGVPIGTERAVGTYASVLFTEDIAGWSSGDKLQIYAHGTSGQYADVLQYNQGGFKISINEVLVS